MDLFRVRLNCIDHYQSAPTRYDPQLRNDVRPSQMAKGPKVPVVRVFGSTETGQKVCAHIHGAFPYLYVDYEGSLVAEEVGAFIYRLHLSIDHALAVSYRRDQHGQSARFVARITVVKGIPFYGFHVGYQTFLKIYMFNPIVMTRLADLLQQGVIMKRKFQPYEAHLQYLAQFMVDYNLYGCDYLDSSKVSFRSPVPEQNDGSSLPHIWHSLSVPAENITDDSALPRVSHCSIEVDICVQHITNRKMVKERPLHHDFLERIAPIPGDVKLVSSMAGLWKDEARRRKLQMPQAKQDSAPFPPDVMVSMSAGTRDPPPQGWIHEEEYQQQVQQLIAGECSSLGGNGLEFGTFVKELPRENEVNTALQSVEDLYPSNLIPVLGLPSSMVEANVDPASSVDVDEQKVLQAHVDEDEFFPDDSDEDDLHKAAEVDQDNGVVAKPHQKNPILAPCHGVGDTIPAGGINDVKLASYISGVCASGLKTGSLPRMLISQALLDAAEHDGLVGRTQKARSLGSLGKEALKRSGSDLSTGAGLKRPKQDEELSTSKNGVAHTPVTVVVSKKDLTNSKRQHGPNIGSSQEYSAYASRPAHQTMHHEVGVGNQGQKTSSHLSQKRQDSRSQKSSDGNFKKRVSFDPSAFKDGGESSRSQHGHSITAPSPTISLSNSHPRLLQTHQAVMRNCRSQTIMFATLPPSATETVAMKDAQLPDVLYQDAFYSKEHDVPARIREYAGREFRLESNTVPFLPDFDPTGIQQAVYGIKQDTTLDIDDLELDFERQRQECSYSFWEFAQRPPTFQEVKRAFGGSQSKLPKQKNEQQPSTKPKQVLSQIDGPTPNRKHAFKYTQKQKSTSVQHEVQYMSTMSLEVHVNTRGKFVPNPEEDEIQCIFWACKSDETVQDSQDPAKSVRSGILVLCPDGLLARRVQRTTGSEVIQESTELDLVVRMVEIVRTFDPDVLTGYEVHGSSWGFLIERARVKYDYNLCDEFSRMKTDSHGRFGKQNDRWGFTTSSTIRVTGRHMINIWRAMRGELNLLQYTMENVVWHLLHRRIPHYSWKTLTDWYRSGKVSDLSKLLRYYRIRTRLDIDILESNELIPRTSEQARLLGVDFFSVFSRGSQFKVESIMFRIAKPENYLLISPSRKQVGGQNALECLPLVMEPQSAFYSSPVLVLDFQSLYPSVMIAYNYCYSTFLGRISNWRGTSKMGFTDYERQEGLLALLKDYINIAPNGMMYSKAEIRKSLLAKMLKEILETRVMVKSGMKQDRDDKTLQQLLNNRQLALKLLANVTYGYTSASFSGRMPCSEIADSIVQTGRETLERAIAYIHTVERWGAEVVYGDTDSLFVHLKGKTKDQAFDIGNEISKAITELNPRPVKLKFEKVYLPCVLLAKKRYVGYMYETKGQVKPVFDAKGIETVRRDGTPAEQKIEEKALRLLFETADLSQIKEYFQRQCDKIMKGSVSVQDFCFAKEVRLGTYSEKGVPPAGALISTKRMLEDARAEPQYGERVPYAVITGAPGARLIDRCVAPEDLLKNPHWQLDAEYYISKNLIPPLERIFNLVGANVRQWYDEMPKVQRVNQNTAVSSRKATLESYMKSTHCLVCGIKFTHEGHSLCPICRGNGPASILALQAKLTREERKYQEVVSLCQSCSGLSPLEDVRCDSKDCPVFWTRMKQRAKASDHRNTMAPVIQGLVDGVEKLALDW